MKSRFGVGAALVMVLVAWLFGCLSGFVGGKLLREVQAWGRPVVFEDVTTEQIRRFGLPFDRPTGARSAIVAAVGNGMGDTVTYAAIELSPDDADAFFAQLKNDPLSSVADSSLQGPYLDQLDVDRAQRLWPGNFGPDELIEYKGVHLAHKQGTGSIHACQW